MITTIRQQENCCLRVTRTVYFRLLAKLAQRRVLATCLGMTRRRLVRTALIQCSHIRLLRIWKNLGTDLRLLRRF